MKDAVEEGYRKSSGPAWKQGYTMPTTKWDLLERRLEAVEIWLEGVLARHKCSDFLTEPVIDYEAKLFVQTCVLCSREYRHVEGEPF